MDQHVHILGTCNMPSIGSIWWERKENKDTRNGFWQGARSDQGWIRKEVLMLASQLIRWPCQWTRLVSSFSFSSSSCTSELLLQSLKHESSLVAMWHPKMLSSILFPPVIVQSNPWVSNNINKHIIWQSISLMLPHTRNWCKYQSQESEYRCMKRHLSNLARLIQDCQCGLNASRQKDFLSRWKKVNNDIIHFW